MQTSLQTLDTLLLRARTVAAKAATVLVLKTAAVGEALRELQLAQTWHLRRSGKPGSIDNRIFEFGSGEQALGGMDICPISLLGFKAAGVLTYPWLVEAAREQPNGTFVDHVRAALRNERLSRFCVALGAYHRFQWKLAVYRDGVLDWQAKPIASDPLAKWRRRSIKPKQRYLIMVICDCMFAMDPAFAAPALANRGEAHDWLLARGGNPVF
jgi:hypothetical protein